MSPDTLSTRLGELEAAGLAAQTDERAWQLTPIGRKLGTALRALDRWAGEWADSLDE